MQWISDAVFGKEDEITREARRTGKSPTGLVIKKNADVLERNQARVDELEAKAANERKLAQQWLAKKQRQKALAHLKRSKTYDAQAERIRGMMANIEQQSMTVESADMNMRLVDTMRTGADAMRAIHTSMSPDDVHETMDDIAEQLTEANEISEALGRSLVSGTALDVDEDDLEAELQALADEDEAEQLAALDRATAVPPSSVSIDEQPREAVKADTAVPLSQPISKVVAVESNALDRAPSVPTAAPSVADRVTRTNERVPPSSAEIDDLVAQLQTA